LQTFAESVKNNDIKQKLIEIIIGYAQGYGIHKPSPLE
jgi:EAL domain-containing protein (putative c-di-GMP-specific phosphodiesterase class I)